MGQLSRRICSIFRVASSILMVFVLLGIARPVNASNAGSEWWDNNWTRCRKITFDNSTSSEALNDFPVLVRLTGDTIDYSACKSNGGDLRFIDADGSTTLSYEIETWNPEGESDIWVKIPELDNTNTDHIYMYYGNKKAANGWDVSGTWSNEYAAVFHMSNHPGEPEFKLLDSQTIDSTQGIATDGTYFYLVGWGGIQKYDADWNLVLSNPGAVNQFPGAHLGAGACYAGHIYIPVFSSTTSDYYGYPCYIAVWSLEDLSFTGAVDISEQGYFPSAIAIDTDHNLLWVCSYIYQDSLLWKYDLTDLSYQGNIPLSIPLRFTQGLAYKDGMLYVQIDTPDNQIWAVSYDGTVQKLLYNSHPGLEAEGIDYSTNYMYATYVSEEFSYLETLRLSTGDSFYTVDSVQSLEGRKKNLDEPVQASGIAGQGQNFAGDNDYIDIGDVLQQFDSSYPFTIEANISPTSTGNRAILSKQASGWPNAGVLLELNGSNKLVFRMQGDNENYLQVSSTKTANGVGWTSVAATYNGTGSVSGCKTYIDGVGQSYSGSSINLGSIVSSAPARIGIRGSGDHPFSGNIDEVRVSNVVRTASWLNASYLTISSSSFATIGVETQRNLDISVSTLEASGVITTSATLNGSLASTGTADSVATSFEYGLDTGYGSTTPGTPDTLTEPGTFSALISGLKPSTTYHYRAVATGDETVYGDDMTFVTVIVPPQVTTMEASNVEDITAVLNGHLDDLGSSSSVTVSFEYGLTSEYGASTSGQVLDSVADFSASLTGLEPSATYHFRTRATSKNTISGGDQIFTTKPEKVTLNVQTSGQGSVYREPDQPKYDQGLSVEVTAAADTGWSFTGWSGDLSGNTNPVTITLDENKNITATFTQNEYTLHLDVNPDGSGQIIANPAKSVYRFGDSVTLTAQAGSDFTFDNWSGSISGTENPHTIVMDGSKSITANFSIHNYQLTTSKTGQGSVTRNPDRSSYTPGSTVQLTATPSAGWSFSRWSGDLSGSTNPVTVTMNGNKTITAVFTQNEYTLTMSVDPAGSGTVSRSPSKTTYHYGDVVTLTASGSSGYVFNSWSGDLTGANASASVTIRGNTSITAHFVPIEYMLHISINGQGTVSRSPEKATYSLGDTVQLTAVASPGWTFNGWSGNITGNDNPASVIISGDRTVTATFIQNEYTLTTTVAPADSGSIIIDPAMEIYHYGDVVTLTAQAAKGYAFKGWSGTASDKAASISIIINGNTSVTANFKTNNMSASGSGGGGGGGGGGGESQTKNKVVNLNGLNATGNITVNNEGIVETGSRLTTTNNLVTLDITQGTELKDASGAALTSISASKITAPEPPANNIVIMAYEFGPEGAAFNPPLTVAFHYRTITENTKSVTLAWWNGSSWETVPATVDIENGTVTAQISHFSKYALLAPEPAPAAMAISDISIGQQAFKPNEVVAIQVTVSNSGDLAGDCQLVLKVNDRQVENKNVTVAGGKSEIVTFNVQRVMAGEYRVDINGRTGRFIIADQSIPATRTTPNTHEPEGTGSAAEIAQPSVTPDKTVSPSSTTNSQSSTDTQGNNSVLAIIIPAVILAALAVIGVIFARRKQTNKK